MFAIISELDPESSSTVNQIWQELCKGCGLTAIYNMPLPHLTWMVAEDVNIAQTKDILAQIVKISHPLTLHTFGLGIFSGKNPVLYLPTVKTIEMITLHEEIWRQVSPVSSEQKMYYSPKLWVPHITLAINDLNEDNLACAVNAIAFETIELFIRINNLSLARYEDKKAGERLLDLRFSEQPT